MQILTLLILSFLAGSLIKLADDIEDKNLSINRYFAVLFGVAYGLLMGYLMIKDPHASTIFGGIILGCLLTGKINSMGHYFGLASILIILFLNGIIISPVLLVIALLAALDELADAIPEILKPIFKYRPILKLGTLVLVILKILEFQALIILFSFDIAYILTERIDSRLSHEI